MGSFSDPKYAWLQASAAKKRLIIRPGLISQVIDFLNFVFQIRTEGPLAGEADDTPHFRKNYLISSGNP